MGSPEHEGGALAPEDAASQGGAHVQRPFIDEGGKLVVPAGCPEEYRWWAKDGRKLTEILTDLKVSKTVWESYSPEPYPEELQKENYPLLEG